MFKKILITLSLLTASILNANPPVIWGTGPSAQLLTNRLCFLDGTCYISGSFGGGVTSLNSITGAVSLVAGSNITVTPSGQNITIAASSSGGTVTSAGLTGNAFFNITNSPITTSGNINLDFQSQAQNLVLASPNGSSGLPNFRSLVAADIPSLSSVYLPLAGGTMTGTLNLNADATSGLQAVSFQQFNGAINGLKPKATVVAASTTALPANTYNNGTGGVGATLTENANGALPAQDGITLTAAQRFLVKNEAAPLNNGIYSVTQVGDAGTPYILTREMDLDNGSEGDGAVIPVASGSLNGLKSFLQIVNPSTVGSTSLTFSVFNSSVYLGDGSTIQITGGNTIGLIISSITDAYVNSAAAIQGTKIVPVFGAQDASARSFSVTGTAGAGFLNLPSQSLVPTSPAASSVNLFADGGGALRLQTSTRNVSFGFTSLTGNRAYTLPDSTGTLQTESLVATYTNKTLTSSSNVLGGVTMTLGSDATGDLYYRNSGGVLTRLAPPASSGYSLTFDGTLPAWAAPGINPSTSGPTFDEFNGGTPVSIGFQATGTAAATAILNSVNTTIPAYSGAVAMQTGTATSNTNVVGQLNNAYTYFGAGIGYVFSTRVIFPTLSTSAERYTFIAGATNSNLPIGTNYILFQYSDNINSGKFAISTGAAATTLVDSGVTVVANTWYTLTMILNTAGTSVSYYINNTLVGTITTNIPTGTSRLTTWRVIQQKNIGTTSRTNYLDYWYLNPIFATPR